MSARSTATARSFVEVKWQPEIARLRVSRVVTVIDGGRMINPRTARNQIEGEEFVQQAVAQIPWGHNVRILDYVKGRRDREWYVRATLEHGWSRDVLVHRIESGLHKRSLAPADIEAIVRAKPTGSSFTNG